MIVDMNYWSKVFKRLLVFILTIIGIILAFKFAVFYMPFLIAFIISLVIEPIIRFFMKHLKLKRRTSSIIIFILVLTIIISLLTWGIVSLVSESYNLLNRLNDYIALITLKVQEIADKIDFNKLRLPEEIINTIQNSALDLLSTITQLTKNFLTGIITAITSIPIMIIYVVITILSLYFICTDKIYMLDLLEHHFPKAWVKKISKFVKDVSGSLGSLFKAQIILVFVSFSICLVGLTLFKIIGLNIGFPLLSALGVAFVDALPIFGSASVMMPWAIIVAINGDIRLAICLLILLAIMAFTRQMLEPKIISGKIGVHPIFTLIAMYTGFRFIGVIGLLLGPIILIVLKNIFSTMIEKGIIKSIFIKE